MCKFWLALVLVFCLIPRVSAVDFVVYDPVISDLNITLTASLSGSSNYYLQGLLRSQSSSKYFGETQNNKGDWIDYVSSPDKEYITSNFYLTDLKNASWSGQIHLRFKLDDPNYLGPGLYDLKLRRFTGNSSSSAGESNTLQINLSVPLSSPSPSPTVAISPSPTPTPTSTPKPSPTPSPSPSIIAVGSPPTGTVAGESTEIDLTGFGVLSSPIASPKKHAQEGKLSLNRTRARTAILLGSGLLLLSVAGYFAYRKYKSVYNSEE